MGRSIVWMLVACAAGLWAAPAAAGPYPRPELLAEPADLARRPDGFLILDARPRDAYDRGHVPGAVPVDHPEWERAFAADEGRDRDAWSRRVAVLGVDATRPVVVYDDNRSKDAARVWWILRHLGVEDVRLLNGGWAGWTASGGPVSADPPDVAPSAFRADPVARRFRDKAGTLAAASAGVQIVDARSAAEHCGDDPLKNARAGAIPGARHLEWSDLLDATTGRFKPADELSRLFAAARIDPARPTVTHCQGGGRASVMAFGLELMGGRDVANYYRGWGEWGNAADTPVETPKPEARAPSRERPADAPAKPNVVLIYADDLGFGDVSCQGGLIPTPNLDRLAAAGLRFTDAHSTSATCTPSRYALLTGEYPWRKKGTGVLPGDARLIIDPDRTTLADVMKTAGYATGVVGKWHLGLGTGNLDWNGDVKPGPLEIGFDSCFLVPATGDRVPTVYVEDHRVAGLDPSDPIAVSYGKPIGDEPTGREHPELLKQKLTHGHDMTIVNGISRIGYMTGGKSARWVDEDMADVLTGKATAFIAAHKASPFFLYFSTHDIHVPRVPHARFRGGPQGLRGDAIRQLDWSVGEVLKSLEENGLAENTLVIFSSDNGPILDDGYADEAVERVGEHKIGGPYRGNKYSQFEAGTRVPFFVRWPAKVRPGTSEALVCQMDLIASLAALLEEKLPAGAAPDAENVLPALLGESKEGRADLVEHAGGRTLREGRWKYVPAAPGRRAGGAAKPHDNPGPEAALYDLAQDAGERKNVIADHPDVAQRLAARLKAIENAGGANRD